MLFKLDRIFGQPPETASMRLNLNRALRIAFRLKVRPEFVSPLDPKAPRLIDLEDLTGVGDPAIGETIFHDAPFFHSLSCVTPNQ